LRENFRVKKWTGPAKKKIFFSCTHM
jgi:hypothetical protein